MTQSQHLTDMEIQHVSLVDRGANKREFAILKRAGVPPNMPAIPAESDEPGLIDRVAKALAGLINKADAPMPATAAAMTAHLTAALPGGHAVADSKVAADASMADLTKQHSSMHGSGSGAKHSHGEAVAKATTFATILAGEELRDALDENFWTLKDAMSSAMWATDDNGVPLSLDEKKALVAQNLDEFKAYVMSAMDSGIGKSEGGSPASMAINGLVAKVGRKISAARLAQLKQAADALNVVLAEVEASTEEAEKRADAQEVPMTSEELAEIQKTIADAVAPIAADVEALKKAKEPEAAGVAKSESPVPEAEPTLTDVINAIGKLADRVEKIENARGERTSAVGQDPTGPVKKSGQFAGVLSGA